MKESIRTIRHYFEWITRFQWISYFEWIPYYIRQTLQFMKFMKVMKAPLLIPCIQSDYSSYGLHMGAFFNAPIKGLYLNDDLNNEN